MEKINTIVMAKINPVNLSRDNPVNIEIDNLINIEIYRVRIKIYMEINLPLSPILPKIQMLMSWIVNLIKMQRVM